MSTESPRLERPIGVLALQGDFAAHGAALDAVGQPWIEVRYPRDLREVSGLILPGGESTTVTKLLSQSSFSDAIISRARGGMPVYGTCAGAILLAREVIGDGGGTLALMDVRIERNAYGRQIDSFIGRGSCPALGPPELEMVFIRAPIVRGVGPGVQVLASWHDDPVFLKQDAVMLTTFHPELSTDTRVHRLLARMALEAEGAAVR
jgi:5'-phosphate synthase pdxT subunit